MKSSMTRAAGFLAVGLLATTMAGACFAHGQSNASIPHPASHPSTHSTAMSSPAGTMRLTPAGVQASKPSSPRGGGAPQNSSEQTTDPALSPEGTIAGGAGASIGSACTGDEQVNCQARAEAAYTASGGDPNPVWSAPTPTAVPDASPSPAISEPAADTQTFEQSGGTTVATTEGGGPTLADCMTLWSAEVHMTKALWKDVCIRTMNGIDEPLVALGQTTASRATGHAAKDHAHR